MEVLGDQLHSPIHDLVFPMAGSGILGSGIFRGVLEQFDEQDLHQRFHIFPAIDFLLTLGEHFFENALKLGTHREALVGDGRQAAVFRPERNGEEADRLVSVLGMPVVTVEDHKILLTQHDILSPDQIMEFAPIHIGQLVGLMLFPTEIEILGTFLVQEGVDPVKMQALILGFQLGNGNMSGYLRGCVR